MHILYTCFYSKNTTIFAGLQSGITHAVAPALSSCIPGSFLHVSSPSTKYSAVFRVCERLPLLTPPIAISLSPIITAAHLDLKNKYARFNWMSVLYLYHNHVLYSTKFNLKKTVVLCNPPNHATESVIHEMDSESRYISLISGSHVSKSAIHNPSVSVRNITPSPLSVSMSYLPFFQHAWQLQTMLIGDVIHKNIVGRFFTHLMLFFTSA